MKKSVIISLLSIFLIAITAVLFFLKSSPQLVIPNVLIPTPVPQSEQSSNPNIHFAIADGALVVNFSSSLSASMQQKTTLVSNPMLSFTTSWTDGQTLSVQPTSSVNSKQLYAIKVTSPVGGATWNVSGSDLMETITQQHIQQAQSDQAFSQRDQQIITNYPWINDFPIMTNDFFVYFDPQQKAFIATLFPSTKSNIPYNTQIANFKQEVLSQIASYGIDSNQYKISWEIVPNGGQ